MEERVEIEVGVARGDPATVIASRLARSTSAVTRELTLGGGRDGYKAAAADKDAALARCRPKLTRFEADPVLAAHVEWRMGEKDSPMTMLPGAGVPEGQRRGWHPV